MSADNAATGPARERPDSIARVHRYDRRWWTWLQMFNGAELADGEERRCEVQPPVPYSVRFRFAIEHNEAPVLVRASVSGDAVGDATLTLDESTDEGCTSTPRSSLALGNRPLKLVSRFAAPIARSGTTGCSIRGPVSSSPAPSSLSWATR